MQEPLQGQPKPQVGDPATTDEPRPRQSAPCVSEGELMDGNAGVAVVRGTSPGREMQKGLLLQQRSEYAGFL